MAKKAIATQWVRFLADAELLDHTGAVAERYRAGEIRELRADKAQRWIRRDKAEPWREGASAAPAQAPAPAAPAPHAADPGVPIPAHWPALHWKAQTALATRLAGREIKTAAEAREIIDAEAARRAAKPTVDDAGMAAAQEAFRKRAAGDDDA